MCNAALQRKKRGKDSKKKKKKKNLRNITEEGKKKAKEGSWNG
jgi:hypothetical protein